jgi:formyltetrahydrofolate deformylase
MEHHAEEAPPVAAAVLTLSCPEKTGIVHAVSGFLVERACTILESQQYSDPDSRTFFMRVRFGRDGGEPMDLAELHDAFAGVARAWKMQWRLLDAAGLTRTIVMVSRYAHCLNGLLFRTSTGELKLDIACVVSNHLDLRDMSEHYGVPFRHVPISKDTKPEAEAALMEIIEAEGAELIVLARYMQILSPELCDRLQGRAINIHHSMLPSFKGARPYHEAHARGVKAIGATAHYVTAELDEGPIIDQRIGRVDHTMTAEDFAERGRGLEEQALATAVRWHSENRVVLNGNRTVVLR